MSQLLGHAQHLPTPEFTLEFRAIMNNTSPQYYALPELKGMV